jgi:hypothetical protein
MSIILYGPGGSGKTHAAIAHAKCYSNNMECAFSVFSKYQDVREFVSVPILVINELNDSHYDLCDDRHTNKLITIATTNLISMDPDGSIVSSLDKRYTEWRFDCYGLTEPLSKKWIVSRREEKLKQYEEWNSFNEISEEYCTGVVDYNAFIEE